MVRYFTMLLGILLLAACGKETSAPSTGEVQNAIATDPAPFVTADSYNTTTFSRMGPPPLEALTDTSHLLYFGYYWNGLTETEVVTTGPGVTTGPAVDYQSEVDAHTNLVWVGMSSDTVAQIDRAQRGGKTVLLEVGHFFFTTDARPELHMHEDYALMRQRFRAFWQANIQGRYDDTVKIIYPLDEPYHHFVTAFWPWEKSAQKRRVHDHLQRIGAIIKEEAPGVKLALTFEGKSANDAEVRAPANYDWLGYYCYGDPARCYSYTSWTQGTVHRSLDQLHQSVKAKRTSASQKIYIIPEAIVRLDRDTITPEEARARFLYGYRIAASDPDVIMVAPFLWRSFRDGSKVYRGVREVPLLREATEGVGAAILQGRPYRP